MPDLRVDSMVSKIPKYLPYKVIIVATTILALVRVPLIPFWKPWHHVFAFFFQITVLTLMWWIMTSLNRFFNREIPYRRGLVRRLLIQITTSVILCSPFLVIVNYVTKVAMPKMDFMTSQFMTTIYIIFVLVISLITFSFYGSHFFESWKTSVQESAQLMVQKAEAEKEKSVIQYQHLKNQVNPHFLFNTLTSLDGLVLTDPPLASKFIRHLSRVYRYVLEHSENEVVTVQTELEFINHYLAVLSIKYKSGLNIDIQVSETAKQRGIAMVTLQMLIDNAIKHNVISAATPLTISIYDEESTLVVKNNKQIRKQVESSTRQGLAHLKYLYRFLSQTPVEVMEEENFEVKLPLL